VTSDAQDGFAVELATQSDELARRLCKLEGQSDELARLRRKLAQGGDDSWHCYKPHKRRRDQRTAPLRSVRDSAAAVVVAVPAAVTVVRIAVAPVVTLPPVVAPVVIDRGSPIAVGLNVRRAIIAIARVGKRERGDHERSKSNKDGGYFD
jgi:hypothetical protein